jgi:hypothetical protein
VIEHRVGISTRCVGLQARFGKPQLDDMFALLALEAGDSFAADLLVRYVILLFALVTEKVHSRLAEARAKVSGLIHDPSPAERVQREQASKAVRPVHVATLE